MRHNSTRCLTSHEQSIGLPSRPKLVLAQHLQLSASDAHRALDNCYIAMCSLAQHMYTRSTSLQPCCGTPSVYKEAVYILLTLLKYVVEDKD